MTRLTGLRANLERLALRAGRAWLRAKCRPDARLRMERIGTDYGGWIVPTSLIEFNWRCYCGGVGEDVSFDLGIIRRFGCEVYAFDPTPRAIEYVGTYVADEPRFHFDAVGLWSADKSLRFYAPKDSSHVSHSVVNLQGTETYFEAPCRSLTALMDANGHDEIHLLKLDIEGAEHEVLRSMVDGGVRPIVVCTEIDQPVSPRALASTVGRMLRAGYRLTAVDGWNLTFVRDDQFKPVRSGA